MEEIKPPKKIKLVIVRVTVSEAETMRENAQRRGMTLSRYIRFRTLFDKN